MSKFIVALVCLCVSSVLALPRHKRDIFSSDEDFFPIRTSFPSFDVGRVWDDDWPFSSSSNVNYYNPFKKAFSQMENALRNMQREINQITRTAVNEPGRTVINEPGVTTVVKFPQDFDPSKYENKTESRVEVVGDNIVQTNETVYSSGDKNRGQVFRFKSVFVRPKNPPTEKPEGNQPSSTASDAESVNPHRKEEMDTNNDVNSKMDYYAETYPQLLKSSNEVPSDHQRVIERFGHDLSRDTKVNELLSQNQQASGLILIEPDAEIIDPDSVIAESHRN